MVMKYELLLCLVVFLFVAVRGEEQKTVDSEDDTIARALEEGKCKIKFLMYV